MKEYNLIFRQSLAGKMFIDADGILHIKSKDGYEFISLDAIDIDEVMDVLLEEDPQTPRYKRLAVSYLEDPEPDKTRNIALSIYSKSGRLKAHMYIHELDEKICFDYIEVDSIVIRHVREDRIRPSVVYSEPEPEFESVKPKEIIISERVKYFRELCGLNMKEAAEKAGIAYGSWVTIERKPDYNPSLSVLKRICSGFGISLKDFLFDSDEIEAKDIQEPLLNEIRRLSPEEQITLARILREKYLNRQ